MEGTMTESSPSCKVCDQGKLIKKKKYRMSAPVVLIGYIFLVPSILGILFGIMMFFTTTNSSSNSSTATENAITEMMQKQNIPNDIIDKVLADQELSDKDKSILTPEQLRTITAIRITSNASSVGSTVGTVIAGGFSLFTIVFSFIGGLVGWLLTMKKKVLQCTNCGAVIGAS